MKKIGLLICIIGTLAALILVPCKVLGMNAGWHFIFGSAGFGMMNYQFIDTSVLLIELILINGIGFTLFFLGKKLQNTKSIP